MPGSYDDDDELLASLQAGEQLAHYALGRRFGPRMKALVKRMKWSWCLDGRDLQEIMNDSCHKVIERIHQFDPNRGASFRTWVLQIAENTGRDRARKASAAQRAFEGGFDSVDRILERGGKIPGAVDLPDLGESADVIPLPLGVIFVREALGKLTQAEWEVVTRYMHGLKNPEIAKILGKKQGAVRISLMRGLAHLKELVLKMCEERGVPLETLLSSSKTLSSSKRGD